jgi:DNA polymerase-3 subunit delta
MIKLFHGKNTFLSYKQAQNTLQKLQKKYSEKDLSFASKIIDASSTSANKIISEIDTPSLFHQKKIIMLKRLSANDQKKDLQEFIISANKNDLTEDIVVWETEKIRSNTNYYKSFKKNIYESPELNKRTFITWAKKVNKKQDINLTRGGLELLAERTNFNPERYLQELNKLKLTQEEQIDKKTIDLLCPDTLERTVWDLIDNINDGQAQKAAQQLENIVEQGNDPFFVLLMIARNLRLIFLTKRFKAKNLSTGQIASKTKSPPFVISKISHTLSNTSYRQIKRLYQKLCNIDYAAKTGQLDIKLALDILLSVI